MAEYIDDRVSDEFDTKLQLAIAEKELNDWRIKEACNENRSCSQVKSHVAHGVKLRDKVHWLKRRLGVS